MNDLTSSNLERQNILNNRFAVEEMQKRVNMNGYLFNGEYVYTKKMVADFYEVDTSTIDRYLASDNEELGHNGYFLCKGKSLKEFKLQFGHLINEVTKTTQLGLFSFRAFLNIGMLLTESEKARALRSLILDLVIEIINQRTGGGTMYINRRDARYLPAAIAEENYRKNLTTAINNCVSGHPTYKYAQLTDFIYKAIFRENAREYRNVLSMEEKSNIRHTFYAEILLVISSFENGIASSIRENYEKNNHRMLTISEVEHIISKMAEHPMQKPYLHDARTKMASRDYNFRDAYHENIAEYLKAVTPEDYERFMGDASIDFDELLEKNKDVLQRLK